MAWKTLWITTGALTFSFATWFIMSALVVKLNGIGFKFTQDQLFWLAAMPGLAGGSLRIIHSFIIPIYGTRHVISISTFLKLIPCIGVGFAVMDTTTPFWVFMVLAFLTGFGGGDFSSYMPSTNLFFPKKLKGTALGIQAGIGNFGVSLVQFLTPIMIGVGIYGASAVFTKIEPKQVETMFTKLGEEKVMEVYKTIEPEIQKTIAEKLDKKVVKKVFADNVPSDPIVFFEKLPVAVKAKSFTNIHPKKAESTLKLFSETENGVKNSNIYLQTAAFWYIPLLLIFGVLSWIKLRSVPVKASIKEQLDIFSDKHTWYCTITYIMTFGGFSGLAAAFPMLIKSVYGSFPNAPDPLTYAFYGPLIGSASRVLFGFVADKTGGGILTTISGLGLIIGTILLVSLGLVAPTSLDQFPMFVTVMLGLFFFTGIGNAATFRQYPIIFQHNPRQAAGVIGWTAAVAAFGPFLFSILIMSSINASGTPNAFFIGLCIFAVIATLINWNFYHRKGCVRPS
ncbi:MAG: NarK/NasA family nitrate transporter [Flavobacteriia bacterium]|nr:NarK/NasA family nitrate transporter [Flavobacteriia bacterium]